MSSENVKNLEVADEVVDSETAQAVEATKQAESDDAHAKAIAAFNAAYKANIERQASERIEKTRKQQAVEAVESAMESTRVFEGLKQATYQNASGKWVISATSVYDLLYRPEFARIIDSEKSAPDEWQFARVALAAARKAICGSVRANTPDEKKAAWVTFCDQYGIGYNVDSVPSTNANLSSLGDFMLGLLAK